MMPLRVCIVTEGLFQCFFGVTGGTIVVWTWKLLVISMSTGMPRFENVLVSVLVSASEC